VKQAKKSSGGIRRPSKKKTARKARPHTAKSRRKDSFRPSSESADAHNDPAGGPFAASISRIFDLQRKVLRAGTAAARSAVDNPASKLVKDGVTESLQGGLRKLEQVFDERVASALDRMGMPSPEALREVCATVAALTKSRKGG
jgi:hypothetical protein